MSKPSDSVPSWASNANFPNSTYPAEYPWGDPHPFAGDPTPWSGEPTKDATALAALAAQGHVPAVPTLAPGFNEFLSRLSAWAQWVEAGSDGPAASAHIVETDADGTIDQLAAALGGSTSAAATLTLGMTDAGGEAMVASGVATGAAVVVIDAEATSTEGALLVRAASGFALRAEAPATGSSNGAISATGGAGGAMAIYAAGGAGITIGALGGASAAATPTISAKSQADDAPGILGETADTATLLTGAVYGRGKGKGAAVIGESDDGYGVVAQGKASTPAQAALRVVPQDAVATAPLEGDWQHLPNEGPIFRAQTAWRRAWHSIGGRVHAIDSENSGAEGSAAFASDGSNHTIATASLVEPYAPRASGFVTIRVALNFGYAGNVGPPAPPEKIGELRIFDATAGGVVASVGVIDLHSLVNDGLLAASHSFSALFRVQVFFAGARTYRLQLRSVVTANIAYENASIEVEGMY